jgi:hypothetical protein
MAQSIIEIIGGGLLPGEQSPSYHVQVVMKSTEVIEGAWRCEGRPESRHARRRLLKTDPVLACRNQEALSSRCRWANLLLHASSHLNHFFMNRFRQLGFIHYNAGLQVHSALLNVVLHD